MEKHAKGRRNIEINPREEVKVFDIRHTAPQHRQFLTHGGFGIGTPYRREKQHQQRRAMEAQESVLEHRLHKAAATDNAVMRKGDHFKRHAIKTKYGFDRVVEDLILEAMSKGDFNNLSGAGKPLKNLQSQNPYVDFTTHKMNKILMDNGFVPEWILLQKEIKDDVVHLKDVLRQDRAKLHFPLALNEDLTWRKMVEKVEDRVKNVNKKIDKFNLIVPVLEKQMVHFQLSKIAVKILKEEPKSRHVDEVKKESQAPSDYKTNLFSLIDLMWK